MPYKILDEQFKTKSALADRIREIMYSYEFDKELSDYDLKFMKNVLDGHPSVDIKIGCGIKTMVVRQNPFYKKNRGFWIIRTDGTEVDFSFLECLKPTTQIQKFKNACRKAISNDIILFRINNLSNDSICPITGTPLTLTNVHVDHIPPMTFDSIVNSFIIQNNIDTQKIKTNGEIDGEFGDKFEDDSIAKLFVDFHNNVASLRLVSQHANLSVIKCL